MDLLAHRLRLTNFRSYPSLDLELGERTLLVGRNAAGKTNVLEALYLLSSTKSFRADREREMIRWGEDAAHVAARVSRGKSDHEVSVGIGLGTRATKKLFSIDQTKRPAAEIPKWLPAALFSADDVRLIDGSPGRRRRALDLVIGQSSAEYLESLRRYGRVLASRNRLLEQIQAGEANHDELDFWDAQLIETAEIILAGRQRFSDFVNNRLTDHYRAVAPQTEGKLEFSYEPLTPDPATEIPKSRERDIAVGTTTTGPHRDDWKLLLGNRPIISFGSGGEFRTGILAFRLAEADWLAQELSVVPIVLLDDVFSELDASRREALLTNLPRTQVIITTPEKSEIPKSFSPSHLIEISKDLEAVSHAGGPDV